METKWHRCEAMRCKGTCPANGPHRDIDCDHGYFLCPHVHRVVRCVPCTKAGRRIKEKCPW